MENNVSARQYVDNAAFVAQLGSGVLSLLAPKCNENILDLGCGDGALSEKIVSSGANVLAVDYNQDMVNKALERGLTAEVCDAEKSAYENRFDAVFSNAALHWMTDYSSVIKGVHKALKAGGRFVAEFGEHDNLMNIRHVLKQIHDESDLFGEYREPCFNPTLAFYKAALEKAGFKVIQIERFERPTPLGEGAIEWFKMYTSGLIKDFDQKTLDLYINRTMERLRKNHVFEGDSWTADFVRLRFYALRA